jgi:hypothetical protein
MAEHKQEPLFQNYAKQTAILLVDASGSTNTTFQDGKRGVRTVFDTMLTICSELGHPQYRVLFWNAPQPNTKFATGVNVIPFIVKPDNLGLAFLAVKSEITQRCLTHTNLAFSNIPQDWLKNDPMIYLVTDGEIYGEDMDGIKRQLRGEIEKLSCRLVVLTVENKRVDYKQEETIDGAAGSDVFKLIQESKLTRKVSQFISYTLPSSTDDTYTRFVHINRNDPPKGFIPYEQRYFSELRTHEFYQFIVKELKDNTEESKQLQIAQNLANTLFYLTKDKPERLVADIIANFARLFTIDANVVQYILTDAIEREKTGTAGVFAAYHKDKKELYKEAGKLLSKRVNRAIGVDERSQFMTCAIEKRILVGNGGLVNRSLKIKNGLYPKSSYERVPVFPMERKQPHTELQEQCIRQWLRVVYGYLYGINQSSDEIIFHVLAEMVIVVRSPNIPNDVKQSYIALGRMMLRKKRANSMQTEIERLEEGEFPIPNSGKPNDFFLMMARIIKNLSIVGKPMRLWNEICQVLGGRLVDQQQRHYRVDVNEWSDDIQLPTYEVDIIPDACNLDYTCLVTLEDISTVGGYRIQSHPHVSGVNCFPIYLFSENGKNQLIASNNCVCPICYQPIRADQFTKVDAKREFKLPASYGHTPFERPLTKEQIAQQADHDTKDALSFVVDDKTTTSAIARVGPPGKLVVLRGVVGSGKTTTAELIKQKVEARGGTCWVEGTDKYCVQGKDTKTAIQCVETQLREALASDAKDKVVVIDTCGEHNNGKNQICYFGVTFKGWKKIPLMPHYDKKNEKGYLVWSLWNVLKRSKPTANSNYYLNPETATVRTCLQVHEKKARGLSCGASWNFSHVKDATDIETSAAAYSPPPVDLHMI